MLFNLKTFTYTSKKNIDLCTSLRNYNLLASVFYCSPFSSPFVPFYRKSIWRNITLSIEKWKTTERKMIEAALNLTMNLSGSQKVTWRIDVRFCSFLLHSSKKVYSLSMCRSSDNASFNGHFSSRAQPRDGKYTVCKSMNRPRAWDDLFFSRH